jgi:D-alanine-D-alanine ligase
VPADISPGDVSILILYNLDPSWESCEMEEAAATSGKLDQAISELGYQTTPVPLMDNDLSSVLEQYDSSSHLVFNWCEEIPGIPQSEPLIAQGLEALDFTFTGAGYDSLALAQDKYRVKQTLDRSGVPTPKWRVYDRPESDGWDMFPAIVKAANEHCSMGITRESVVMNEAELISRISYVLETQDQSALVEDFIDGREFHVSLWGNGHIEMLPPAEMDFSRFNEVKDRLCTYDSKFTPGSRHYEGIETLMPAPLTQEELQSLQHVCQTAYRKIGCRDYGRIDLRIRNGVFYVLDVNPNADISADASMACAAEHAGYSYGELGSRIIQLAAKRHPRWLGQRRHPKR